MSQKLSQKRSSLLVHMRPLRNSSYGRKKINLDSVFFTISFVGSQALASALGEQGKGVYVSQVVPTPDSKELLIAWQYREALRNSTHWRKWGCVVRRLFGWPHDY